MSAHVCYPERMNFDEADGRRRLGEAMTERRARLDLSQETAARRAGTTAQGWRNWEHGDKTPRPASREHIEQVLEWSRGTVAALLSGADVRVDQPRAGTKESPRPLTGLSGGDVGELLSILARLDSMTEELSALRGRLLAHLQKFENPSS